MKVDSLFHFRLYIVLFEYRTCICGVDSVQKHFSKITCSNWTWKVMLRSLITHVKPPMLQHKPQNLIFHLSFVDDKED